MANSKVQSQSIRSRASWRRSSSKSEWRARRSWLSLSFFLENSRVRTKGLATTVWMNSCASKILEQNFSIFCFFVIGMLYLLIANAVPTASWCRISSATATPPIFSKFLHQGWRLLVQKNICDQVQPLFLLHVWKETFHNYLFVLGFVLVYQFSIFHLERPSRNTIGMCSRTATRDSQIIPFNAGTWLEISPGPGRGRHRGGVKSRCCQVWSNIKWPGNVRWLCSLNGDNSDRTES